MLSGKHHLDRPPETLQSINNISHFALSVDF